MRIPRKKIGGPLVEAEEIAAPKRRTVTKRKTEKKRPAATGWKAWPQLTQAMLRAHAQHYGIDPAKGDPVAALRQIELGRATKPTAGSPSWATDPRVTEAQLDRYTTYCHQATKLKAVPQSVLFGFTGLIDANFDFSAEAVLKSDAIDPWRGGGGQAKKSALEALADSALDGKRAARSPAARARRQAKLEKLIDQGPPDGGVVWRRPRDQLELVASMVRQLLLSPGDSEHLILHDDLAQWLEDVLADHDAPLRDAMGGAGIFGANVGATREPVSSRYYAAGGIPSRIASRCGERVRAIDGSGKVRALDACVTDESARVNYIANYDDGARFSLFGKKTVSVNGKRRRLTARKGGRIILGKPGRQDTTFGDIGDAALRAIAKNHDAIVMSGLDYHTAAPPGTCPAGEQLAAQIDVMRRENPDLQVHWIYKVPKVDENEPILMAAMRGRLTSLDLNATELPGLLSRMAAGGLLAYDGPKFPPEEQLQDPAFILDGANLLMDALGLKRINVRGFPLNMLIQEGCRDPARQRSSLFAAVDAAMVKAAQPSGELTGPKDLAPTPPIVDGTGLAAVHAFADKLQKDFGRDDDRTHDAIVKDLYFRAPDRDRTYVVAPGKKFYDRKGGLVSCGDTMGVTAFLLGQEDGAQPKLMHFRTLAQEM